MAKTKNIVAEIEQTFNLGNYQSIKVKFSKFVELEEGESDDAVIAFAAKEIYQSILETAKPVIEAHGVSCPSVEKLYMGKPIDKFPNEPDNGSSSSLTINAIAAELVNLDDIPF